MNNPVLQSILDFFHVLATIVWIGGMIITNAIIRPAMKKALQVGQVNELMGIIMQKFRIVIYIAIVVLGVTGIPMKIVNDNYVAIIDFSNSWETVGFIKHVFAAILALLTIYMFEFMPSKIRRAMAGETNSMLIKLQNRQKSLGGLAFICSLVILFLSVLMKYL